MSGELSGKTAIVTGAGKGIGLAIAKKLAGEGATVVCADIDEASAHTAGQHVSGDAARCDVTDEAQVQQLVSETVARHGKLDVLVTCAGVASVAPLVTMTLQEWRRVLAVDLDGVFLCTKHGALAMAQGGGGSIVNIASIKAFGGSPATGHYGAAKAGVVSLSKTAAIEMRDEAFGNERDQAEARSERPDRDEHDGASMRKRPSKDAPVMRMGARMIGVGRSGPDRSRA